jgi:hypothetical protein
MFQKIFSTRLKSTGLFQRALSDKALSKHCDIDERSGLLYINEMKGREQYPEMILLLNIHNHRSTSKPKKNKRSKTTKIIKKNPKQSNTKKQNKQISPSKKNK